MTSNAITVCIQLNSCSIFVDCDTFNVIDLSGIYITAPNRHIDVGTGARAIPSFSAAAAVAAITATATATTLTTNNAIAATTLAVTLSTRFNIKNLPPDTKARHNNHLDCPSS